MADFNEIKSILEQANLGLDDASLDKLAKSIAAQEKASTRNNPLNIDPGAFASIQQASEEILKAEKEYIQLKREDLQINEEIARLSGDAMTAGEKKLGMLAIEAEAKDRALITAKELTAETEDEQREKTKLVELLRKQSIISKANVETQKKITKFQEAGVRHGENLAAAIGVTRKGLTGALKDVNGLVPKLKAAASYAQGMGKGLLDTLSPMNILGASVKYLAGQFLEVDKINYRLYQQTGLENLGFESQQAAMEMQSLSIVGQEAANAQMGLLDGIKGFRDVNPTMRTELIQTTALLEQQGVSATDTGKALGYLTATLGLSYKEAEEQARGFEQLAEELGRPASEIVSGFNQAAGQLAKYGPGMQMEFKRLARASKVLNMDVGQVMKTFGDGFDTFEGAQTKAASLNALLGGPFLNGIELLGMSESERLMTLKETLDAQGTSFDQMSKFQRMGIARQLGMDESELGNLMNANADDLKDIFKERELQAKKQEEMAKRNADAMDVMSRLALELEKTIQEAFGGIDGLFSPEKMKGYKDEFNNFVADFKSLRADIKKFVDNMKKFYKEVIDPIATFFGNVLTTIFPSLSEGSGKILGVLLTGLLALKAPMFALKLLMKSITGLGKIAIRVLSGGRFFADAGSSFLGPPGGGGGGAAGGGRKGGGRGRKTPKFNAKNFTKAGPVVQNAAGKRLYGAAAANALSSGNASIIKQTAKASEGVGKLGRLMKGLRGIGNTTFRALGGLLRSPLTLIQGFGTALSSISTKLPAVGTAIRGAFAGLRGMLTGVGSMLSGLVTRARGLASSIGSSISRLRTSRPSTPSKPRGGGGLLGYLKRGASYVGDKLGSAGRFVVKKAGAAKDFVVDKAKAGIQKGKDFLFKRGFKLMKSQGSKLGKLLSKVPVISTLLNGAIIASIMMRDDLDRMGKAKEVVRQGSGMMGSGLLAVAGSLAGPIGTVLGSIGGQMLGQWIGGTAPVQNFLAPLIEPLMPGGSRRQEISPNEPKMQVDDGVFNVPTNVQMNSADQVVAVKEGGLMDRRFKEMVKLLKELSGQDNSGAGGGREIVLNLNGRELGRAVVGQINRDHDLNLG